MLGRPTRLLDRTNGATAGDALSDVLRTVRLAGALFFRVEATAPWCAEAPDSRVLAPILMPAAQRVISYHAVTAGRCWAALAGNPGVQLEAGDVVVFPHGDAYSLSTKRGARRPVDVEFFRRMVDGQLPFTVRDGGGQLERVELFCGFLGCDVQPFNPLLSTLPRAIVVRRQAPTPSNNPLGVLLDLACSEAAELEVGGGCVLARISELLFIETIRQYVRSMPSDEAGWLSGLRDPVVGRALSLIHGDPSGRWTLDRLARKAGVSRSGLVTRFRRLVGEPPMQYLTRWRMQKAAQHLLDGKEKMAAVAARAGYESEAAFSRVFKKVVGVPPGEWRRANLPRG